MGKVYWIRHAEKAYKNGRGTPPHDPPLVDTETPIVLKNVEEPSYMILSPYLRTRQTAQRLVNGLGKPVRVESSADIAEYLGHWSTMNVEESTLDICPLLPPPRETMHQLRMRCKSHISSLRRVLEHDPSVVVWVITHGIVIDTVKSIFGELNGVTEQNGECLRILRWEMTP